MISNNTTKTSALAALLLTSTLLLTPIASAKESGVNTTKRERVNLKIQDTKIEDFIKMVGKVVGKNILLAQKIPGTVNFVSSSPIYKDELMDILLAVIGKKGFTLVEDGSFLRVERANTAVKRNLPIGNGHKSLMHTEFIDVQNENVDIIAAKVRQFLSEGGKLLTVKESNTMIISDFAKNITIIKNVVSELEEAQSELRHVEFIELTNAKASRIATILQNIAKNTINQKVVTNKLDIASDDASNSIIIMGSRDNVDKITPFIPKLDIKDGSYSQRLTIIPLENSEAVNVVTSITKLLEKKKYIKETDKPMVSAYEELNALIVSATEADIKDIKEMVSILDVEKPQVFVRARIIEIAKNASDSIGVKYGLAGGTATENGLFTFSANMGGSPIAFDTSSFGIAAPTADAGIAFGAAIDFLSSNGAARALSEPTLLCVNNQESTIYVGKTESIVSSTVQGNQSTDLARNTFQRQDIGLTLKIKPRLSSGNKVTLVTSVKQEDISSSAVPGLPSTIKREVTTTAIVQNGESVIIGGLISDKKRDEEQGIPGLRHIPWLGQLFSWNGETTEEINLVIILTPYIVRSTEDLTHLRKLLYKLDKVQGDYEILLERKLDQRIEEMEKEKEESS